MVSYIKIVKKISGNSIAIHSLRNLKDVLLSSRIERFPAQFGNNLIS